MRTSYISKLSALFLILIATVPEVMTLQRKSQSIPKTPSLPRFSGKPSRNRTLPINAGVVRFSAMASNIIYLLTMVYNLQHEGPSATLLKASVPDPVPSVRDVSIVCRDSSHGFAKILLLDNMRRKRILQSLRNLPCLSAHRTMFSS